MTRLTTIVANAARTADRLEVILPAALSALHDARPGYPATVPGSGSIGGGSGGVPTSSVERLAGTLGRDRSLADYAELRRCVLGAERLLLRAHQIATAHTSTTTSEVGTTAGAECCASHERVQDFTAAIYRTDLCRFCYEYKLTEGVWPPVALLVARAAAGGRVTPTMVRHARVAKGGRK